MRAKRNIARPLIASAVLSALVAVSSSGLAADEAASQANPASATGETSYRDAMFKRLDSDHDGYISRAEATRQPRFMDAFQQADDDRDSKLSNDEYIKARAIYERQRVAEYAKDTLITAKVKAALLKDPVVSVLEVSVETAYGEVLLSGFVDDARQARRARELAASVEGVKQVHANLVVKG